jgi:energy-coupling factor transporter ATP-binding protein EcfA2
VRLARLADYKRRVQTKSSEWPLKLRRFAFTGVPSLGTAEVALASPFLILSGPNGVGKTTVLRAIWAAADPSSARPLPGASLKLTTGSAILDYDWNGEARSSAVNFVAGKTDGGEAIPTSVVHLDASSDPLRYQRYFCEFQTYDDIINGVGANTLDDKTLAELNYICKRDYRTITIYEVETGDEITPFFEVQVGGDRYDSRTMGAGELTALHTWWAVNRAADNSLLLIEEPETFLSPASQEGMAHFLLVSTVDKKLVTVMTSHSAKIIDSVADEHRLFLYREGAGAKFAEVPVTPRLLATVGIEPAVNKVLMVEDQAASFFLRLLLEYCDPTFARTCEISVQGGDGNIVAALERIGGRFQAMKIIGVFDGDLRGKVKKTVAPFAAFLPGGVAIETIFRELITADVAASAEALSKPKLGEILFTVEGADHHDWYESLCEGLSLTKAQLFPMMFGLWIRQTGNEDAAFEAMASFRAALAVIGTNEKQD